MDMHRPVLTFVLSFLLFLGSVVLLYRTPKLARALEQVGGEPSSKAPEQMRAENQTRAPEPSDSIAVAVGTERREAGRVLPRVPARTYTRALPGESLAQVAGRVYGSPAFARALWTANRDQLADPAVKPTGGMILRTPRVTP